MTSEIVRRVKIIVSSSALRGASTFPLPLGSIPRPENLYVKAIFIGEIDVKGETAQGGALLASHPAELGTKEPPLQGLTDMRR